MGPGRSGETLSGSQSRNRNELPYIRPFYETAGSCISYFVCCPGSHIAIVIDPGKDIDQYLRAAAAEECHITHVIDTHIHADHVSGARKLVGAAGDGSRLCMTHGAETAFDFEPLREGDEVVAGEAKLKVVATPGHTKESISLLYTDTKRSSEPWGVFTGDCLFVGDVGRLDLDGHGTLNEAYQSLCRLLDLPDYVEVYPAHYAGSDCASNRTMSFKTTSTIGYERRFNKMLQATDLHGFEGLIRENEVSIPRAWRDIKQYNRGRLESINGVR